MRLRIRTRKCNRAAGRAVFSEISKEDRTQVEKLSIAEAEWLRDQVQQKNSDTFL